MTTDSQLLEHAAALLDAEAQGIRECHNRNPRNPDWAGEEDAKRAHDDMRSTATRLYEMAVRMRKAA